MLPSINIASSLVNGFPLYLCLLCGEILTLVYLRCISLVNVVEFSLRKLPSPAYRPDTQSVRLEFMNKPD
jgi:hypothetical protein